MRWRRTALFSAAGTAVLGAIMLTMRFGPQPKGADCFALSIPCETDAGRRYVVLTVSVDVGAFDVGVVDRAVEAAEARGCDLQEADLWHDTDGGVCAAQPNAVRRIERDAPHRCRCAKDGGTILIPCRVKSQDYRIADTFGCDEGANAAEAP